MTDTFIYDDNNADGRPATEEDIAAVLGGLTAADGTSYLDIFDAARDDD